MKAISQDILGGPEVLRTVEAPRPTPRTGQVLVRMCATSVNPVDCKLRAGVVTHLGPPPFTLGFDLSGTVVEIGPEVESFQPGDEVFGMIFSKKRAPTANSLSPTPILSRYGQRTWIPFMPASCQRPR